MGLWVYKFENFYSDFVLGNSDSIQCNGMLQWIKSEKNYILLDLNNNHLKPVMNGYSELLITKTLQDVKVFIHRHF